MNGLPKFLTIVTALALFASGPKTAGAFDQPRGVTAAFKTPDASGLVQVAVRSSDVILLGSTQSGIWRWNPAKNSFAEERPAQSAEPILHLQWDQNGRLFAGSGRRLEVRSAQEDFESVNIPQFPQVAVSPAGDQIAGMGEDPPIRFFSPATGKQTHRVDLQVWVDEMKYSPDGEFLATTRYGRLYLWNSGTGDLVWKSRLEGNIKGFGFTPDQTRIYASMAREGLWMIDASTGNILKRYARMHDEVDDSSRRRLAFSPDGMLLADTPAPDRIEIWETFTGRSVLLLDKHPGRITALGFLKDGARFVSVDDKGNAYLWDLSAAELAAPFDVTKPYSQDQLGRLWQMLGEPQGDHAWTALVALRHRPQQALELIDHPPNDDLLIQQLIERLDDDQFTVRQAAYRALRRLSLKAEPFLKNTLSRSTSAEVKVRIRRLLASLAGPHREAQIRLMKESQNHRLMRIVQLLKWLGTAEAKTRIEKLRDTTEVPALRQQSEAALLWLDGENGSGK